MQQWSDDVITARHPNTQATAMSIDFSGNLALLGSRRNLTLIDLNKPKEVLRRINLNSKWDISRVKWNPFLSNQQYFLTTYNQWTDLWHYNQTTGSRVATFSGHTRAISDVDWSSADPNLLATCSLDQYIYLWDIRETKKPKLVTSTVSGASCVRWNKFDEYTLASSHDGNIRVWDIRNGKAPTQYITAHVSSINYLDWSPVLKDKNRLASASQDTNISFWNMSEKPREAERQINAQYPIWRAEFTPFGTSIASLAFRSYRETPLTLWNYANDDSQPVHIFNGHTDVVLDFQWRKNNDIIWQLVTWSKDQLLRLFPIDYSLFLSCGGEVSAEQYEASHDFQPDTFNQESTPVFALPNSSVSSAETQTSETVIQGPPTPDIPRDLSGGTLHSSSLGGGTVSSLKSGGGSNTSLPDTLDQEFRLLNVFLPNLTMNQMDRARRFCTVTLRAPLQYLVLHTSFPNMYPLNEAPVFKFIDWSENIDKDAQEKLLLTLRETAQHHTRNNRGCLEPCLRQLTTRFREMSYSSEDGNNETNSHFNNTSFSFPYGQFPYGADLRNIPFPRTSGARFCSAGYLVFFTRPTHVKGFYSITDKIPRSLTGLLKPRRSASVLPHTGFEMPFPTKQLSCNEADPGPKFSVSSFYYKEKRPRRIRYQASMISKEQDPLSTSIPNPGASKPSRLYQAAGKVVVVDLTGIMPVSKGLAFDYVLPEHHNFSSACQHNKEMASREKMPDLVQVWSCVSYLPNPNKAEKFNESVPPFQSSPLGRTFLSNLMGHYSKLKDVQTLAMLACTFDGQTKVVQSVRSDRRTSQTHTSVKRSMSHQNFDVTSDSYYGLHKSSSESKFPDPHPSLPNWLSNVTNMIGRSPTSESSITKYFKSPAESPSDDYKFADSAFDSPIASHQDSWLADCRMLNPDNEAQYNLYKTSYCSLLERWKMNTKIVEIKRHASIQTQPATVVFKASCKTCEKDIGCSCPKDLFRSTIRCVICQLPVKSLWSFCGKCYHGGHMDHLQDWFANHNYCPSATGCQCDCVSASSVG